MIPLTPLPFGVLELSLDGIGSPNFLFGILIFVGVLSLPPPLLAPPDFLLPGPVFDNLSNPLIAIAPANGLPSPPPPAAVFSNPNNFLKYFSAININAYIPIA